MPRSSTGKYYLKTLKMRQFPGISAPVDYAALCITNRNLDSPVESSCRQLATTDGHFDSRDFNCLRSFVLTSCQYMAELRRRRGEPMGGVTSAQGVAATTHRGRRRACAVAGGGAKCVEWRDWAPAARAGGLAVSMRYLHTMVRVANIDQSLDFYCNKLGMQEVRRRVDEA